MKEISFSCPNCGTEFTLTVKNPVVDGHKTKAQMRIEALQKAGIDTHSYFAVMDGADNNVIARMENGIMSIVKDDDPVFNDVYREIIESGVIDNPHLFRRWVMAQMFHILADEENTSFDQHLAKKGYDYQWKSLINELRVQAKIVDKDPEGFAERNTYINNCTALCLCSDYKTIIVNKVAGMRRKRIGNKEYITFDGVRICTDDFSKKIFEPIQKAIDRVSCASTPYELYKEVVKFSRMRIKLPFRTRLCGRWVDDYQASGSYFTLKNLVLFHDCHLFHADSSPMTKEDSKVELKRIMEKSKDDVSFRHLLYSLLKAVIKNNDINVAKKIEEWKK